MNVVHLLSHIRGNDEYGDDAKLIGAYSSSDSASAAIDRLKERPGFADWPAGFTIDNYEIDKDHWVEGFLSAPD